MHLCLLRTCYKSSFKNFSLLLSTSHYYRHSSSDANPTNNQNVTTTTKKYSETLILPKTDFPAKIPSENRKLHEHGIASELHFDKLYNSQRQWRRDQAEFVLHDGPPYANGQVHIGHAVNKILKDVTNRYKLLQGYRVNYIPGWDCHGLPIELKASKVQDSYKASPLEIRNEARQVAIDSIESQMNAFKRWGIMADWNNVYKTFDKDYVKSQLQLFYILYEKGYIYRDLKPVYWSPTSHTALAEAELEYNQHHESPAIMLKLDLQMNLEEFSNRVQGQIPEEFQSSPKSGSVNVVVWTTTPWTLPANKAVAYNEGENYSLVFNPNSHPSERTYYVIASKLVDEYQVITRNSVRVLYEFGGVKLKDLQYKHPWFDKLTCPLLPAEFVTMDKGTGLVHIAPAHGHDDFVLSLRHKLPIECFVDDEGKFDERMDKLEGVQAMTLGNAAIIKMLGSNVLHQQRYTHSYPYDWRTKKPVIIKTSKQWFINTQLLMEAACKHLENVRIYPKNVQHGLLPQLMRRPYWCISRQRVWGVPIPVLYNKITGEPLVKKDIIDKLCDIVDEDKNVDRWWTGPISDLINEGEAENYTKGNDIFDIWLDSGLSWNVLGDKVADLYLEGQDQFTGWFQAALLTSVALRDCAPFKNIFVHGFVVDEQHKKMSKSLGNVVDPFTVTDGDKANRREAYGVDVLRWWAATQGSVDGSNISISNALLRSADENIQKLRLVLRFLLCFANERTVEELDIDDVNYDELEYMDQYMLNSLRQFQDEIIQHYDNYAFHRVLMRAIHFTTVEVSSKYFTWVKDRLYCDRHDSQSRKSAIYVLDQIYMSLIKTLGPILPYLTEESYSYYSSVNESFFKYPWSHLDASWENPSVKETLDVALDVATSINQIIGQNDRKKVWVEIFCNQKNYKTLQVLHPDTCNSELCDILQVSGVDLRCSDQANFSTNPYGVSHSLNGFSIGVSKTEKFQCVRCRRYCCNEGSILCSRCSAVLKRLEQEKIRLEELEQQRTETLLNDQPEEIRGRT